MGSRDKARPSWAFAAALGRLADSLRENPPEAPNWGFRLSALTYRMTLLDAFQPSQGSKGKELWCVGSEAFQIPRLPQSFPNPHLRFL